MTFTGDLLYSVEHAVYAIPRRLITGEWRTTSSDFRQRCGMGMIVRMWDTSIKRIERIAVLVPFIPKIPLVLGFKGKDKTMKLLSRVPIGGSVLGITHQLLPHNLPTIPIMMWVRICPVYRMMTLLAPVNFAKPKWWSFREYS